MKNLKLIILMVSMLGTSVCSIAQETDSEQKLYTIVDQNASFPGGPKGWSLFLMQNLKYPLDARAAGLEGKVYIQFDVDTAGVINKDSARVVKSPGELLSNEAMRVFLLSPDWVPAEHEGRKVPQRLIVPIVFLLQDSKVMRKEMKKMKKSKSN